jgi:hypothetical protein
MLCRSVRRLPERLCILSGCVLSPPQIFSLVCCVESSYKQNYVHITPVIQCSTNIFEKLRTLIKRTIIFFFNGSTAPLGPGFCFFSFMIIFTDGRTPWTSDPLVARPLPKHRTTQTQNKHIHQTSMPCVEFELTIPASELAKTVQVLDRSATVTGHNYILPSSNLSRIHQFCQSKTVSCYMPRLPLFGSLYILNY